MSTPKVFLAINAKAARKYIGKTGYFTSCAAFTASERCHKGILTDVLPEGPCFKSELPRAYEIFWTTKELINE